MPPANDSALFESGLSVLTTVSFEPPSSVGSTCHVIRTGPSASISGSQRGWNDKTTRRPGAPVGLDSRAVVVPDGLVAIGDRLPDAVRGCLDVDRIDVIEGVHRDLQ